MSLWLPILLASVVVQILATVVWVLAPHHKSDFKKIPDENELLQGIRTRNLSPGQYTFPFAMDPAEAKRPEVIDKFKQGPVGFLTITPPGMPNIGAKSGMSFVFYLCVSLVCAYVASRTLTPGTEYLTVFRVTGTVAFMSYAAGGVPETIWFGVPWTRTLKTMGDALVYALFTGGMFGWLWP